MMKTQIVYVAISSDEDYFLEELWVSVFSLRHYHPNDRVVVLTDLETCKRINERPGLKHLFTEIRTIDMPANFNNRLRSRIIKTNIRNYIDGDFLFIDTDTVICGSLEEIDKLDIKNIAMVPELHGPFQKHITYEYVKKTTEELFDINLSNCPYWFNSGCMLVRDNQFTRLFFLKWHETWKWAALEKGAWTDQKSLLKVDAEYGYAIERLPDIYNCQIALSVEYFCDAKILHFWHMRKSFMSEVEFCPFLNKDIYKSVRRDNCISKENIEIILHPKNAFNSPSVIVGREEQTMLMSPFYTFLWQAYNDSWLFKVVIDVVIKIAIWRNRIINKINGKKKDTRW